MLPRAPARGRVLHTYFPAGSRTLAARGRAGAGALGAAAPGLARLLFFFFFRERGAGGEGVIYFILFYLFIYIKFMYFLPALEIGERPSYYLSYCF